MLSEILTAEIININKYKTPYTAIIVNYILTQYKIGIGCMLIIFLLDILDSLTCPKMEHGSFES